MRSTIVQSALFCAAVAACVTTAAAGQGYSLNGGVPNLQSLKSEIISYYGSGRQSTDVSRVEQRAKAYVATRLQAGVKRPAVVFDIDDTALSSFAYEKSVDFGYDAKSWNSWELGDRFPAISATLQFSRFLRAHHVAVFFVTGRRASQRAATLEELAKAGYAAPAGLYLRPASDRARSVIPFKSASRAKIQALGYDILASVGDQWSDLRGGHAERIYKLPNPMYFLP